jgi:hypothetical protein
MLTNSVPVSLSLICAVGVLFTTPAVAQHVQGSVTIAGGSATDVVGTTSRALSVSPIVSLVPDSRLRLSVGATGTRYDDQRWSLSGQAATTGRLPVAPHLALTLNANAGVTGTSYDFSYSTATATPALETTLGAASAFAGVSGTAAQMHLTHAIPGAPGLLGLWQTGSTTSASTTTRAAHGVVFGGNLRLLDNGDEALVVGVRQNHTVFDSSRTTDRTALIAASSGRLTAAGAVGMRTEPGSPSSTFGSGSLTIAVDSRIAIEAAGGSYAADPLIGTPGGRYVTLGLSLKTGQSAPRLPRVEGVPAPNAGFTRLSLRADDAHRVEVAGDFSHWKFVSATRASNGVWFADLRIPPGQYRYAFRIDGTTWMVPDGAEAISDGFGGKSAWLTVGDPPNNPAR